MRRPRQKTLPSGQIQVSILKLFYALVVNICRLGRVVSGASTITQQLIKNLTNDTQVTLNRKITEATLAIGLTQQYPKEKILEMYFNVSPFGAENLGVEAAVEDYFHLNPQCDKNFKCIPGVYYLNCDAAHIQQCRSENSAINRSIVILCWDWLVPPYWQEYPKPADL